MCSSLKNNFLSPKFRMEYDLLQRTIIPNVFIHYCVVSQARSLHEGSGNSVHMELSLAPPIRLYI